MAAPGKASVVNAAVLAIEKLCPKGASHNPEATASGPVSVTNKSHADAWLSVCQRTPFSGLQ